MMLHPITAILLSNRAVKLCSCLVELAFAKVPGWVNFQKKAKPKPRFPKESQGPRGGERAPSLAFASNSFSPPYFSASRTFSFPEQEK
ncbi:Nucleolar Pre-Ribosomal-Associated Protein 1 [Manis pentadactyla]|nr:Nucleolar Pre-Ribosomal-Associated Protein 1 [Manis pentadactyla]